MTKNVQNQYRRVMASLRKRNCKTGKADSTFHFLLNTAGAQFDSHLPQMGRAAMGVP